MLACRYKSINNADQMTKIDARSIYGKTLLKIFFPGTTGSSLMKVGMKQQRPTPFGWCSNYDPGLTLTYFNARSRFAT